MNEDSDQADEVARISGNSGQNFRNPHGSCRCRMWPLRTLGAVKWARRLPCDGWSQASNVSFR